MANAVTPGGRTVLAALRKNAPQVTCWFDGSGARGGGVRVVVIGEKAYAEFEGERASLALDPEDIAARWIALRPPAFRR